MRLFPIPVIAHLVGVKFVYAVAIYRLPRERNGFQEKAFSKINAPSHQPQVAR